MSIEYYYAMVLKLLLSTLFAAMVGLEREIHGSAAGLRTHILVAVGSCLIMLTSIHIFHIFKEVATCDPSRIAAGVVTGIGFLGAGTILRYRASVMGLTTAASIWAVAAIGLAIGTGFYAGGLVTTLLVMLTLILMSKFEHNLIRKDWYRTLVIDGAIDVSHLHTIRRILTDYRTEIRDFEIEKIPDHHETRLRFDIKLTTTRNDDNIILELMKIDGVNKAHWE